MTKLNTSTAPITDWELYAPTTTGMTIGNGTLSGRRRRVGDSVQAQISLRFGSTTSFTSPTFGLETGLVIDVTKLAASDVAVGYGWIIDVSTGIRYVVTCFYQLSSGKFVVQADNVTSVVGPTSPFTWETGDYLDINVFVPIVGFSSNIVTGERSVEEYAFNTSGITAAGATNTVAFGNGAAGALIGAIDSVTAASDTIMRVRFQTPIQATDKLFLEINDGITSGWVESGVFFSRFLQSTSRYGVRLDTPINETDVDVRFGNRGTTASGATYADPGVVWLVFNAYRWRVRKVAGGGMVGYPILGTNILNSDSSQAMSSAGAWTLGPPTGSSLTHTCRSGARTDLAIVSLTNANPASLNYDLNGSIRWRLQADATVLTDSLFVYNAAGNAVSGVTQGGAWTVGSPSSSALHRLNGAEFRLVRGLNSDPIAATVYDANGSTLRAAFGISRSDGTGWVSGATANGAVVFSSTNSLDVVANILDLRTSSNSQKQLNAYNTGSAAFEIVNRGSGPINFYSDQAAGGSGGFNFFSAVNNFAACTNLGGWTVGPAAGAPHLVNGSVAYNIGSIASGTSTPNVANITVLRNVNGTGTHTIQGFSGGRVGQVIYFFNNASSFTILQPNVGTQHILTFNSSNVTINGNMGCTLVCDGNNQWHILNVGNL